MFETIEPESNENEEFLKGQIIDGLKSKGVEDPEVKKKLTEWTIKQEEKVELAGRTVEARINFEMERALLYFEGGYVDEALETLDAALCVAEQEDRGVLVKKINDEILRIEDQL